MSWSDEEIYQRTIRRLFERKGRSESAPTRSIKHANLTLTQVKFADTGRRIRGFASTSSVDRMLDVVEPAGMVVSLPISLLWQHDRNTPIGTVVSAEARGNGIWIEADVATGTTAADDAWSLISTRAVDQYSIGFLPLENPEPLPNGGWRYKKWELLETSVVSVAANRNTRIQRGKGANASDKKPSQRAVSLVNMAGAVRLTR